MFPGNKPIGRQPKPGPGGGAIRNDMDKKVMYVVPVLAPYLASRFRELGKVATYSLEVVLESRLFPERPAWVPVPMDNVQVTVLDSPQWTKRISGEHVIFNSAHTKALPIGLVGAIHRSRPQLVVVCNPTQFCLALLARLFIPFRLGVVLEDTPTSEGRKPKWVQLLRARAFREADFLICFSQDADSYARAIAPSVRRYRSSWSVDSDWLNLVPARKCVDESRAVRFLFVGALIERKGVLQLVQAWTQLAHETDGAELVIVGDGALRSELEDLVGQKNHSNVSFVGAIPYEQVREHYMQADIFVLPTLEDLFSLVVTEAMAMGLPVITTIYNGARELVTEGETGFLCDPLSPHGLEEALRKGLRARGDLQRMGNMARDRMTKMTHELVMRDTNTLLTAELVGET